VLFADFRISSSGFFLTNVSPVTSHTKGRYLVLEIESQLNYDKLLLILCLSFK
jgi:hypothetical protein